MKLIVNLYAVALGYLFRYASVGEIAQQYRRLQTRHFDILKCRSGKLGLLKYLLET